MRGASPSPMSRTRSPAPSSCGASASRKPTGSSTWPWSTPGRTASRRLPVSRSRRPAARRFLGALAAVVLPGSVALTLLGLGMARQSLNLMTLGGIAAAIGLVLDDAIVIVEHLAHEGARGRDRAEALAELAPTVFASSFC